MDYLYKHFTSCMRWELINIHIHTCFPERQNQGSQVTLEARQESAIANSCRQMNPPTSLQSHATSPHH